MFKRSKRLKRVDFAKLHSKNRFVSELFTLTVGTKTAEEKYACVVSKKVSPKAVVRNLVKRRTRAALREVAPTYPGPLVFTAKKPAAEASYKDILADVSFLIDKAVAGLK